MILHARGPRGDGLYPPGPSETHYRCRECLWPGVGGARPGGPRSRGRICHNVYRGRGGLPDSPSCCPTRCGRRLPRRSHTTGPTGANRLAPLLYVSPQQINFRVPADTALGEATLTIVSGGGKIEAGSMQVDAVAPAIFTASAIAGIPAAAGVLQNPDGTQVPVPVATCSGGDCQLEMIPLSTAGGRPIYLSFFGTGFRGANLNNVTCSASGVRLPVLYAGPQGTPGVDQINVKLSPKLLDTMNWCGDNSFWSCDATFVTIRIAGVPANSFWLWVQ